ncbi:hypothetical protein WJX72_006143 [[Myrmecia] bisecta]|uniref:Pentatricopeptide repeat-containing protein n=1 Tax=[Myrmecia] bisecta TaxID=41462 RepID=A0AAW1P9V2_9CHLO
MENRARGYRRLWQQVNRVESGQTLESSDSTGLPAMSVEDLVSLIQKLPPHASVLPVASQGLFYLDSRAVAALLKELSKVGHTQHAQELFDWLRTLGPEHELHKLCDVFTYTTVIALCGQRQQLRKALELVAEMRSRAISCNVHTYSALMNVCIKSGELELALDVFHQLQVEGCQANVVTFNTLVDVYGKLGRWEDAIHVIDVMQQQGLEAEVRTYNTVIIACNMCSQPQEALRVYDRMLRAGHQPTSTTFTALISAYGKANQLDKALGVFRQMVQRGCERNVITYSSLVSACEKAGSWQLALELFDEMQRDGCHPNTVTYNSLITACAQGAQWERAEEVFRRMKHHRCKPDVVTYTALITAYDRGHQWLLALTAFEHMQQSNCRPDSVVYNTIIDCLWQSGVISAQAKAINYFQAACNAGVFNLTLCQTNPDASTTEVTLSAGTPGVALLAMHKWLIGSRRRAEREGIAFLRNRVVLVIGRSHKVGRDVGSAALVRDAVHAMLQGLRCPVHSAADGVSPACLEANAWQFGQWLLQGTFFSHFLAIEENPADPEHQAAFMRKASDLAPIDMSAAADCRQAFAGVRRTESSCPLSLQSINPQYLHERAECIALAGRLAESLQLQAETLHDAVVLMDRVMSTGMSYTVETTPLLTAACLSLAARLGAETAPALPSDADVAAQLCLPAASLSAAISQAQDALRNPAAAISPLRVLKLYLQRLCTSAHNTPAEVACLAGGSFYLAAAALSDTQLLTFQPSLVAAAVLVVDRMSRGWLPAWPTALAALTGWQLGEPHFAAAVQAVCRVRQSGAVPSQAAILTGGLDAWDPVTGGILSH